MNLMTVDAALKGLPVRVSERRFRAVARRIGRFKMKGREMCVTASDVEAIPGLSLWNCRRLKRLLNFVSVLGHELAEPVDKI